MTAFRILPLVFAALVAASPAAAQDVGVAAAVNQSAQGTQPNLRVRTIGLGDNVIHNERIDTNSVGLVQLLLADGTTFTVGPISSLVIDSFVYNPEAGTAQVAATLTKGVLRFIGAATSKTENGVAITTPVGVVGIRGGVTDINMTPPAGIPPHVSMIFGSSVTLSSGGTLIGRLFDAGYSLAATGNGIETVKTPPEWASQIQQALSSAPGQTGGAPRSPTSGTVNGVTAVNSGDTEPEPPTPQPPIDRPDDLGDDLINDVLDLPDRPQRTSQRNGFAAGILRLTNPNGAITDSGLLSVSVAGANELTNVAFDANGDPVSGLFTMILINNCGNSCAVQVKIDPLGSMLTALDQNGNVVNFPVQADLKRHDEVPLPTGVNYCQCTFLNWGFWDVTGTLIDPVTGAPVPVNVTNGTWAVADNYSTPAQLDTLANVTATFQGHAVGTYTDAAANIGPTLTAGNMVMNWAFGTRTGTIDITGFGGRNLNGTLVGDPSLPGFIGDLGDGANTDGFATGSFVNDNGTIARGVLGDFYATDGSWTGSGIFMGQR